ncbi:MAG: integrase arm-type DNA-binding domain-containing protein [Desulfobulbus sp.]|nr:integrase arm-type DNA-binding domain-containing protein [Desulfobulbus sp.]
MLTAIQVRNAKPKEKAYKLTDGKGLFLHIATSGKKTWRYRYELPPGKESTFVIGEYPVLSLEAARAERVALREIVKAGENPAAARKQKRQETIEARKAEKQIAENNFEAVAREWHQQQLNRWAPATAQAVLVCLERNALPFLGDKQVDRITPPMVLEALRAVENRGALGIARKTIQAINGVLRYAVQTGKATYNPAADMRGVLKAQKVQHRTMVSPEEMPDFLRALTAGDIHQTTKSAIWFTILTAARSGEVRYATWSEVDLDKRLWAIPADRMKMKSPHTVPLSKQAVAILERMKILHSDKRLIFPGVHYPDKPLSENTMLYALYRIGYHSKATMHGFRALFSTIANETGFNPDAVERQLAHREKNAIRAAYHRSEYLPERIKMMQWWADHLQNLEYDTAMSIKGDNVQL